MLLTDIVQFVTYCLMLLFFLGVIIFDLSKMRQEKKSKRSLSWYRRSHTIIGIGGCAIPLGLLLGRLIPLIHQTHSISPLLPIIGDVLAIIGLAIFTYGSFQRYTQQRRAQQRHTRR